MNISPMITNQSVSGNSKAYKTQAPIITIHTDAQVIHNTWPSWRSKTTVSQAKQNNTQVMPHCSNLSVKWQPTVKNTTFADPQMTKSKSNVLPNTCHLIGRQMSEFSSQGMHITDLGKVPDD